MIRITVLTVGKLKEKYLREGCDEYLKRLSAFSKVQVVELPESRCPADPSPAEIQRVLEQEGDSILAKIPKGARVIPLCIEGRELSSAQLAARVADFSQQSSHLIFVIGGSYGLSPRVKAAGDLQLSFGKMLCPTSWPAWCFWSRSTGPAPSTTILNIINKNTAVRLERTAAFVFADKRSDAEHSIRCRFF